MGVLGWKLGDAQFSGLSVAAGAGVGATVALDPRRGHRRRRSLPNRPTSPVPLSGVDEPIGDLRRRDAASRSKPLLVGNRGVGVCGVVVKPFLHHTNSLLREITSPLSACEFQLALECLRLTKLAFDLNHVTGTVQVSPFPACQPLDGAWIQSSSTTRAFRWPHCAPEAAECKCSRLRAHRPATGSTLERARGVSPIARS
mmetsp:Transcript_34369/g.80314  ORF Transcript_34369/g.80314 Transcript_34369/m.80314 type:complete len:200 (-) Transcript_34369:345-944(-)